MSTPPESLQRAALPLPAVRTMASPAKALADYARYLASKGLAQTEAVVLLRIRAEELGLSLAPDEVKAVHGKAVQTVVGAVEWKVRGFTDAMQETTERPPWVIEDLLLAQSATLVSAHPHALKSLSWLHASLEAVVRKQVWGHFVAPNVESVLFIETEDPPWLVEARIRGFAKGLGLDPNANVPGFHYACVGPFALLDQEPAIRALITEHRLDLIVISTLQNLLAGRDWRSQEDMQPLLAMIVRLSRECPIVLLTHSPWDKKQRRAAGTVTQTANFLTTMHYEKVTNPKTGETFVHVTLDSKAGALQTDFSLRLTTQGEGDPRDPGSVREVQYVGAGWPKGLGKAAVLAAIEDDPEASAQEIAHRTGYSDRYVRGVMKERGKGKAK